MTIVSAGLAVAACQAGEHGLTDKDLVGTCLATAAFVLSVITFWRSQILARRQSRAALSADQVKWANAVIDLYANLETMCFNPDDKAKDRQSLSKLITAFSAEIDKGRFLYPNVLTGYGTHKLEAYRGVREKVLDIIMLTHNRLKADLKRSSEAMAISREAYIEDRKRFVSQIQVVAEIRERVRQARG